MKTTNEIAIARASDHALYVTFKRTGLVIYVDDSTEEEIVTMWNEKDAHALPPRDIEYLGGPDKEGDAKRFNPNSWKRKL